MRPLPILAFALLASVLLASALAARAAVVESAPDGFTVTTVAATTAPPERAWRALVSELPRWWDPAHTFSGDASNLSLDARAGGCFCEKLPSRGSVRHGEVIFSDRGRLLRLHAALGPLQALAVTATLTFELKATETGSDITLTYAVAGHVKGGLEGIAPIVDRVLAGQLGRLASFASSGSPVPAPAGDGSDAKNE